MHQENRRSFVKKSLATSMTFTFSGLIRAHGEESGGTSTTWNPDGTTHFATTHYGTTHFVSTWNPNGTTHHTTDGGTTTWNPDETTEIATFDGNVSIQKQSPHPVSDEDIPTARETLLIAPAGQILIMTGNVVLCNFLPQWNIRILEQATMGDSNKTVLEDCVAYRAQVEIGVDLFLGVIPAGDQADAAVAVCNGFGKILNPDNFPQEDIIPMVDAETPGGPSLAVGYSVTASWGGDAGIANRVGPLVAVGDRLGNVSASSHGYWMTVTSELWPAAPSQIVEFRWKLNLIPSGFINLHQHICAEILNQLNDRAIQAIIAKNPNAQVVVVCDILPLPSIPDNLLPFSQPVFAFHLAPDDHGNSCELVDPNTFDHESGTTPPIEDHPDDPRWEMPDPEIPECPITV